MSEEELLRAKNHLKGSLMLSLESTSARMSNLARQELYFRRFYSLDEILASIETVTARNCNPSRAIFPFRRYRGDGAGEPERFQSGSRPPHLLTLRRPAPPILIPTARSALSLC